MNAAKIEELTTINRAINDGLWSFFLMVLFPFPTNYFLPSWTHFTFEHWWVHFFFLSKLRKLSCQGVLMGRGISKARSRSRHCRKANAVIVLNVFHQNRAAMRRRSGAARVGARGSGLSVFSYAAMQVSHLRVFNTALLLSGVIWDAEASKHHLFFLIVCVSKLQDRGKTRNEKWGNKRTSQLNFWCCRRQEKGK